MKKTIYVCDSCGAESDEQHAEIFGFDLCPDCADQAAKIVTQFVKSSAKTGKIDWGKAQALQDAGWTTRSDREGDRLDGQHCHAQYRHAEEAEAVRAREHGERSRDLEISRAYVRKEGLNDKHETT